MKTSNKILLLTLALLTIVYILNIFKMTNFLKEKRIKQITLSGKSYTQKVMYDDVYGFMFKGNFDVTLIQDNIQMLEIEADYNVMPVIQAQKMGERFNVILNNDQFNKSTNRVKATLHFKSLEYLVGSNSNINSKSVISQNDLFLEFNNSTICLNIDLTILNLKGTDNSKFDLSGKTKSADINLKNNSALDAENLIIETCSFTASENSHAKFNVVKTLRKTLSDNSNYTIVKSSLQ